MTINQKTMPKTINIRMGSGCHGH